jgi:NAD(P)-dependent dehydrogenase (short-subunit alcohol dehydrogenase family)
MSEAELQQVLSALERLGADPQEMVRVPPELRARLLKAAGRLNRPERAQTRQYHRYLRSVKRGEERAADRTVRAATGIREARRAPVYEAPTAEAPAERFVGELKNPQNCYACKAAYRRLHFFYDALCPDCAELNYAKRFQTADLSGRVVVITGARLKIGYQAALRLLRCGATVVATTRFPRDAAARYAKEPDFESWGDRLQVHGLDLRHAPSVEVFCRYLESSLGRLDALINNAAQTVRRPPSFYAHLLPAEEAPFEALPDGVRAVLRSRQDLLSAMGAGAPASGSELALSKPAALPGIGLRDSARLSMIPYTHEDGGRESELFPAGRTDADLQQVDLREVNSWRLTLGDVPTAEMIELQLVNAVAPFILCSKLKPLLERSPAPDRHIVNVSAMEGNFSRRTKTDKHPHTNMAKAALNMMTLTSAPDYAKSRIYMNAVDTGWVTDEDPAAHVERKRAEHDFQPPLDIVDGAARILDPVLSAANGAAPVSGQFLKDYRSTNW